MSVDTYQDEDSGLWGYIIYNGSDAVGTSKAIYDSSTQAIKEGYGAIAESDTFF
ncbi:hypothetical protein [Thiolinea disciformis]|uniref:hypothetical protein n=1 Tax=Thiolinea disciformis TaxID=125614 RepID=UPI0003744D6C|nr:hypothetical protein [Thiolinea disciformis]